MRDSSRYKFGRPIRLPFGLVYPSGFGKEYYDLQIEGIGTKTLVAELVRKYDTIGIDAVAMAVNDVIRSGSHPILVSDAIHISGQDREKVKNLIGGVRAGAKESGCILASGETGNVSEILHEPISKSSPPFDLIVSSLGIVKESQLVRGEISPGDIIIGLESSGIHSNGLSLARRVLLKRWGGRFESSQKPSLIGKAVADELLEPTRIYTSAVAEAQSVSSLRACVHITGDGFAKFRRLLNWQRRFKQSGVRIGLKFEGLRRMPGVFRLIFDTAKDIGTPVSLAEMFRTFNMGYGFAVICAQQHSEKILDSLNRHCRSEKIGVVTSDGRISVSSADTDRPLIL